MRPSIARLLPTFVRDAVTRRVARNTGWLLMAEIVATLVSAVQFPLVARLLGVERFGVLHLVLSIVGLVSALLTVRVWETVIRFLTEFAAADEHEKALASVKLTYGIDIVLAVLVFALVAALAPLLGGLFVHAPDAADLIRLEALRHLFLATSGASTAILRVFDRFRWLSAFNALSAIATFGLVAGALLVGWDVAGYILAFVGISALQTFALYLAANRNLRANLDSAWWRADLSALRAHRREMGVMLMSMNVDGLRKIATGSIDTVVLGLFAGPYHVGIYRLAKQLSSYINRLTNPLYTALYPEVARLYNEHGIARLREFVEPLRRMLTIAVTLAIGGAFLLARPLIPPIFGSEYIPAIPVFYITMFMHTWLIYIWAPGTLLTLGKARQLTTINLLSSATMMALLFVLTPTWNEYGAAVALVSNYVIWTALVVWYWRRLPEFQLGPAVSGHNNA